MTVSMTDQGSIFTKNYVKTLLMDNVYNLIEKCNV